MRPKFGEEIKDNIITIEEMSIRSDKGILLSNE